MENQIKISIIVPVYNAEGYLAQMTDSVLAQRFQNWELIFVNDGSTDGSESILQTYAERDRRIRVVTTENAGACHARNVGIEMAEGEYLLFLDADDYLNTAGLDLLADVAERTGADLILGDFLMENEAGERSPSGREAQEAVWREKIGDRGYYYLLLPALGAKLFRRTILTESGLRFPEVKIGQDLAFYQAFLLYAETVEEIKEPIYLYRWVENSISHSYDRRILDILTVFNWLEELYKRENSYRIYCRYCPRVIQRNLIAQFRKLPLLKEPGERKEIRAKLWNYFREIVYERESVTTADRVKRVQFAGMVISDRIREYLRK